MNIQLRSYISMEEYDGSLTKYINDKFPNHYRHTIDCRFLTSYQNRDIVKLWLTNLKDMLRLRNLVSYMDEAMLQGRYSEVVILVSLYEIPTVESYLHFLNQVHFEKSQIDKLKRENQVLRKKIELLAKYYSVNRYTVHMSEIKYDGTSSYLILHIRSKYNKIPFYKDYSDHTIFKPRK